MIFVRNDHFPAGNQEPEILGIHSSWIVTEFLSISYSSVGSASPDNLPDDRMMLIFLTGLIYSSFSLSHLQSRRFLSIVSAVQPLTIGWIPRNFKFSEGFKILTLNCHFCDSDWKWLLWLENPKLKISGKSTLPLQAAVESMSEQWQQWNLLS